jgi:hypothetical protein
MQAALRHIYALRRMCKIDFERLSGAVADIMSIYMMLVQDMPHIQTWATRIWDTCRHRPSTILNTRGGLYILFCWLEWDVYLGETGLMIERWYDHVSDSRGRPKQHVHRHMKFVGLHQYIMLPLLVEDNYESRALAEIWAIKAYQPGLNRRVDKIMRFVFKADTLTRNANRVRHCKRTRDKIEGTDKLPTKQVVVYTTYLLVGEDVSSTMLDAVLHIANQRGRTTCMVDIIHGTHTVRPRKELTEAYLDSEVSVLLPMNIWKGAGTLRMMAREGIPLHRANTIVFHSIKKVVGLELHKLYLERMIRNPKMINQLTGSFNLAMDLYDAAGHFRSSEITRMLRTRISTWSKERFGTTMGPFKVLNVAYTKCLDMEGIRKYVFDMVRRLPVSDRGRAWVRGKIKFSHERQTRIHELVSNQRRAAKQYKEGENYDETCTCANWQHIPDTCRDNRGCINCPIREFARYDERVVLLGGNAKEVIAKRASRHVVVQRLQQSMERFVAQHIKPFYKDSLPACVRSELASMDAAAERLVLQDVKQTYSTIADEEKLRHAAALLAPMVISQLDKNNGALHVQCRKTWYADLETAIVRDDHYEKAEAGVKEVLEQHRQDYEMSDIGTVAKWNPAGTLAYAYILKKDKDTMKSRPVIACVDHPARMALRILSNVVRSQGPAQLGVERT